jgi:uncharacterized protein
MINTNEIALAHELNQPEQAHTIENTRPLSEFILKVNSRCNLACTYCYMYELADQSWRDQPITMTQETVVQSAIRIAEHAEEHGLDRVYVTFHGGEPLLSDLRDPEFYPWATGILKNVIGSVIDKDDIIFLMQTNGTLLTKNVLEKMQRLRIRVGVSVDGATHDTHNLARKYRNGNPSFSEVRRGIRLLQQPQYKDVYGGLITVINPDTHPEQTYNGLKTFHPPLVDLLLPLAHWDMPPPKSAANGTPYADWLISVYERQRADKKPMQIRMFNEIISMVMGGKGSVEYLGSTPPSNVVIETNGEIQLVDALKSVAQGAPATGLNVYENSFNDLLLHPKARSRQLGRLALADACLNCDVVDICGGGYEPHRYKAGSGGEGFKNTSVYCDDLKKLIGHITSRVQHDVRKAAFTALAD